MTPDLRRVSCSATFRIAIPRTRLLNRRAWGVAVRTEDTAITGKGSQDCTTACAVINNLTGVCRHNLSRSMPAFRTSDCRFNPHLATDLLYQRLEDAASRRKDGLKFKLKHYRKSGRSRNRLRTENPNFVRT
jgi:hypothetical protein